MPCSCGTEVCMELGDTCNASSNKCTPQPCWVAYPGKTLSGYSSAGSGCYSMGDAKALCRATADCNGITRHPDICEGTKWTLRQGSTPLNASTVGDDWSVSQWVPNMPDMPDMPATDFPITWKIDRSCESAPTSHPTRAPTAAPARQLASLAPTSSVGSSIAMLGGAGASQWSGESSSLGTIIGIIGGACAFGFAITGLWICGRKRSPPSADAFLQQGKKDTVGRKDTARLWSKGTAGHAEEGEMAGWTRRSHSKDRSVGCGARRRSSGEPMDA